MKTQILLSMLCLLGLLLMGCQSMISTFGQRSSDQITHYPPVDRAPSSGKYKKSATTTYDDSLCPDSDRSESCKQIRDLQSK